MTRAPVDLTRPLDGIRYERRDGAALLELDRGHRGTTAATHAAGTSVELASDGTPGRDRKAKGLANLARRFLEQRDTANGTTL